MILFPVLRRTKIKITTNYHTITPSLCLNLRWTSSQHRIKQLSSSDPPQWLKDLERKQGHHSVQHPFQTDTNYQPHQTPNENEVIIYEADSENPYVNSPNRIGLSMIGLLVTTGFVANQIRHHGAGPVWINPKSDWKDFELKLWDKSTRILISIGLITFTFWRSLKFLTTLSHTVKRITIKKSSLAQLKKLISMNSGNTNTKHVISSSNAQVGSLLNSIELKFYSVGSIDLINPINKLYKFSILNSIKLNDLINFNFIPYSHEPSETISSNRNVQKKPDYLWLKYVTSEEKEDVEEKAEHKLKSNSKQDPMAHQLPSDPPSSLNLAQLNSIPLQIPTSATWGNFEYGLSATGVQTIFEDKIKCYHDILPIKNQEKGRRDDSNPLEQKMKLMHYKFFGFDFRNSIWFNFNVLKSNLQLLSFSK